MLSQICSMESSVTSLFTQKATSFCLPHQKLAKSHHLSSGVKCSKPIRYINTDIKDQHIYNYD